MIKLVVFLSRDLVTHFRALVCLECLVCFLICLVVCLVKILALVALALDKENRARGQGRIRKSLSDSLITTKVAT